jgi:hypothetical protein
VRFQVITGEAKPPRSARLIDFHLNIVGQIYWNQIWNYKSLDLR